MMTSRRRFDILSAAGLVTALLLSSFLLCVPGRVTAAEVNEGGLSGGTPVEVTSDLLKGNWSWHAVWQKSGGWRHSGQLTIGRFENEGLHVTFESEPKAENHVSFSGTEVTLPRDLSPYHDPNDGQSSQTWRGLLLRESSGTLKIEGRIIGAGMKWETENKNYATFRAVRN